MQDYPCHALCFESFLLLEVWIPQLDLFFLEVIHALTIRDRVVLSGTMGIGKTQIALQVAHIGIEKGTHHQHQHQHHHHHHHF
jgi:hypothetical protein